jgi:hypothetical protein
LKISKNKNNVFLLFPFPLLVQTYQVLATFSLPSLIAQMADDGEGEQKGGQTKPKVNCLFN